MVSAYAENDGTSETLRKMPSTEDIGRSAAQKLRELFARATDWQETREFKVGKQTADLLVEFNMGESRHTLVLETTSLGQPREIRGALARLTDIWRELPNAYPLAVSEYISPQSATLLRRSGLGYLDLSGNCYLSFDNVLIEKEGKPNLRPSTRPLKSLFAPRATRVIRVLLADPQRVWRLEELAKTAEVSLGHAHNVIKRLEELSWVQRGEHQRIELSKAGLSDQVLIALIEVDRNALIIVERDVAAVGVLPHHHDAPRVARAAHRGYDGVGRARGLEHDVGAAAVGAFAHPAHARGLVAGREVERVVDADGARGGQARRRPADREHGGGAARPRQDREREPDRAGAEHQHAFADRDPRAFDRVQRRRQRAAGDQELPRRRAGSRNSGLREICR